MIETIVSVYNFAPNFFAGACVGIGLTILGAAWQAYSDWAFLRDED